MALNILAVRGQSVRWRVFEREMLERYFGNIIDIQQLSAILSMKFQEKIMKKIGAIYWHPRTEEIDMREWTIFSRIADMVRQHEKDNAKIFHINNPYSFKYAFCKEKAFARWKGDGINCPEWQVVESENDIRVELPVIVRLNNQTGGLCSIPVWTASEFKGAYSCLQKYLLQHDIDIGRKIIAVKFYETCHREWHVRYSYRIIVAGEIVITGYARLCKVPDWVAITAGGRFEPDMWDAFVYYQWECQKFCEENEGLIVRAVRCLGLNFQGIDVIIESNTGRPYFLEVQPGFSAGYADPRSGYRPPYYNPTYPPLVNLIKEHENELPGLYRMWLDKEKMFKACFCYLKAEKEKYGAKQ